MGKNSKQAAQVRVKSPKQLRNDYLNELNTGIANAKIKRDKITAEIQNIPNEKKKLNKLFSTVKTQDERDQIIAEEKAIPRKKIQLEEQEKKLNSEIAEKEALLGEQKRPEFDTNLQDFIKKHYEKIIKQLTATGSQDLNLAREFTALIEKNPAGFIKHIDCTTFDAILGNIKSYINTHGKSLRSEIAVIGSKPKTTILSVPHTIEAIFGIICICGFIIVSENNPNGIQTPSGIGALSTLAINLVSVAYFFAHNRNPSPQPRLTKQTETDRDYLVALLKLQLALMQAKRQYKDQNPNTSLLGIFRAVRKEVLLGNEAEDAENALKEEISTFASYSA